LNDFRVAGTYSNMGILINKDEDELTPELRIGGSYLSHYGTLLRASLPSLQLSHYGNLSGSFALETVISKNSTPFHHLGLEIGKPDLAMIRGGYMLGHDSRSLTYGAGLRHNRYSIDFSFTPFSNELGDVWEVGFGILL
ncbi:hypothetical protein ACFLQV_03515, partial [Calditrichota bacterium]